MRSSFFSSKSRLFLIIYQLALRMPVFDPNKHFTKKIDSQIIENDDVPRFYQMTMQYDIVLAIAFSKN